MNDKFFSKLDWAAFWAATIVTMVVYFYTLGPSVGLEDSGELAVAASTMGVPHPPGYPFWTFCSWIFCKVFGFVTYMGHPNPAWAVSLCSATFGAFAAGFTAMLICRSSFDFIGSDDYKYSGLLCFAGGVGGALTFALSPVEWSQSTIVEVYSLNAFFLMWVFLLSYRWLRKPSDKILWFAAFVFGLGLTNYQVLLFAIVPLAIIILMKNQGMFRDVFIYLIPVALTYQVLQIGSLQRANQMMQSDVINKHEALVGKVVESCPYTFGLALALAILIIALAVAAYFNMKERKGLALQCLISGGAASLIFVILSVTVFSSENTWSGVTAPVAPLINPSRYAWIALFAMASIISSAITAVMYSGSLTDKKVSKFFYASIGSAAIAIILALTVPTAGAAGYTGEAYPWAKSTIIFVALIVLLGVLCKFTPKGLLFAIPVAAVQISVFALLKNGAMNGLTHPCSWWFWWPIAWNFILLVLTWIMLPNGRSVAGAAFFAQLGVSFYVYMPIVSDLRNPPMNWGYPRTWEGFKHAIMRGQYEAIGVQNFGSVREFFAFTAAQMRHYFGDVALQFTSIIASFAIVPLAFGHWIVKKSRRKDFWQWMIAAWVCFFMMSFLLILLANVKGDIQDGFIQKVKFISSHAMIAMWIGYGLVFVSVLLKKWIPAAVLAAVIVLGCFVTPIAQNYCNDRLVFEMGGAEQNGHTFGWQFGAYQLEGAKAINDQLTADEEPLPDPGYPPPMTTNALFFGGTDPGRFVPTYMIHGAKYRSDIKLITQNALADDTYMSVERDTYGDEVWIPAKEDSAEAFNIYVDEVQRGVRQANGDLRIENGRVQVTGALGVMEINGILTKMMFDHDKKFRDFYIEESYVIPWMYPYLSPHGLIMKLNAEFVPYDAATASKDRDFWDWYTRRLLDDPMYRRDFAGQKSFSKLRTAIAGLYARQGRMRDAANAYREAVLLYPVSPEATFRYAQESLLPFSKFDIVLELMDYIDSVDPKNKRTSSMRSHIKMIEEVENTLTALEPKYMRGEISDTERLRLSTVYYRIGKTKQAAQVILPIAFKFTAPQDLKYVATVLMTGEFNAEASRVWKLYLKKVPRDVEAWAASAKTHARLKLIREAQQDFISGYKADQASMIRIVQKDQELFQIAEPLFQPRR